MSIPTKVDQDLSLNAPVAAAEEDAVPEVEVEEVPEVCEPAALLG